MASSESTEASTFDNGPLHIDYAAGYATKDGRELSLTPTEYKLLVLLAKNVDKVLTHLHHPRDMGTSWDSDLASLRVFMRTLRKKIEADPSPQDDSDAHGCRVPHAASLAHSTKSCGGIRSR
ncbi:MAG: winged helix-turn-helix domain-containing protein [Collinsella sp.]